jgi:hypothetical protein
MISQFKQLQNPQHIYNGVSNNDGEPTCSLKAMLKMNHKKSVSQFQRINGQSINFPVKINNRKIYNPSLNIL